jgi:hypothetical protein
MPRKYVCIIFIHMCTQNMSYHVSKTPMLPMRTKVTHVHYHLHKKICQIEVFVKHSYEATRMKIPHFLLIVCNSHMSWSSCNFLLELLIRGFLYGDVINIFLCKYKNYGSMNSQYMYLFLLCIKFILYSNLSLLTRRCVATTIFPVINYFWLM